MLLAWLQTILVVSNMLLAKAYGSGGCFWDNGHLYRADQPSPAPGLLCLNWLDAQSGPVSAPESGAGNHSYCRNPDQDPRGPWCYVSGEAGAPEKRPCKDLGCPETTFQGPPTSTTETEEVSEVPGGDEVQVFAPANTLPAQSEAAAVQPVIGISQRVRVNSKEKKDLGTLGYVLGVTMMVIIIGIGAGIVLGYTYKRSVASLLGSLREERKVHKVKADSSVAFLPIKEVRCWKRKTSSRCRDLVLVFTR
ncbi:phosphoinositide-3-kinase-interacting protein 1 isoform X3 [Physeter macrocephalus]|uniref:Phosphoinositide-3-kinase-interacting protein 1 n=1 Tax=Physeter macrocephalus TaxID=9755 RepID=A0A455AIN9_PHYMC|nr:phosphoinositide-3-kinase-interacting protein 1 isoform X3 [Physeter catodon]|eukprot:XP_028336380.1 phosphoinositide-3-kinase-interacting protein 1 isoform X3 [Physeter catodon]